MNEYNLDEVYKWHQYDRHEEVEERVVDHCNKLLESLDDHSVVDASTHHDADYIDVYVSRDEEYDGPHRTSIVGQKLREAGLVINSVLAFHFNGTSSRFRIWLSYIPELDECDYDVGEVVRGEGE